MPLALNFPDQDRLLRGKIHERVSFGPSGGSLVSWVRPCSRLVSASFRYRIAGVCGTDGCAPLCGGILQVRVARNVRGKPCAADAARALPAASFRPRAPRAGMGRSRYMHHAGVHDFFRWRTAGHVPDRHGLGRACAGRSVRHGETAHGVCHQFVPEHLVCAGPHGGP